MRTADSPGTRLYLHAYGVNLLIADDKPTAASRPRGARQQSRRHRRPGATEVMLRTVFSTT